MKLLNRVIRHFGVLALFYFGFLQNIQGARNVYVFLLWFLFVISLFLVLTKTTPAKKGNKSNWWLLTDVCEAIALAWLGHFGYAAMVVFNLSYFLSINSDTPKDIDNEEHK